MKIIEKGKEPIVEINTSKTAITDFSLIDGYDTIAEKTVFNNDKSRISSIEKLNKAIENIFKYFKRKT
jgi:hypothetical protein